MPNASSPGSAQGRQYGQGEHMDDKKRAADQEQLETHSLPGTNQAGRAAGDCEEDNQPNRPEDERDEVREDDSQEPAAKAIHEDDRSRH